MLLLFTSAPAGPATVVDVEQGPAVAVQIGGLVAAAGADVSVGDTPVLSCTVSPVTVDATADATVTPDPVTVAVTVDAPQVPAFTAQVTPAGTMLAVALDAPAVAAVAIGQVRAGDLRTPITVDAPRTGVDRAVTAGTATATLAATAPAAEFTGDATPGALSVAAAAGEPAAARHTDGVRVDAGAVLGCDTGAPSVLVGVTVVAGLEPVAVTVGEPLLPAYTADVTADSAGVLNVDVDNPIAAVVETDGAWTGALRVPAATGTVLVGVDRHITTDTDTVTVDVTLSPPAVEATMPAAAPSGIDVPAATGEPATTAAAGITVDGAAVDTAAGTPAVTATGAALADPLTVAVTVDAPQATVLTAEVTPAGTALPVDLDAPAVAAVAIGQVRAGDLRTPITVDAPRTGVDRAVTAGTATATLTATVPAAEFTGDASAGPLTVAAAAGEPAATADTVGGPDDISLDVHIGGVAAVAVVDAHPDAVTAGVVVGVVHVPPPVSDTTVGDLGVAVTVGAPRGDAFDVDDIHSGDHHIPAAAGDPAAGFHQSADTGGVGVPVSAGDPVVAATAAAAPAPAALTATSGQVAAATTTHTAPGPLTPPVTAGSAAAAFTATIDIDDAAAVTARVGTPDTTAIDIYAVSPAGQHGTVIVAAPVVGVDRAVTCDDLDELTVTFGDTAAGTRAQPVQAGALEVGVAVDAPTVAFAATAAATTGITLSITIGPAEVISYRDLHVEPDAGPDLTVTADTPTLRFFDVVPVSADAITTLLTPGDPAAVVTAQARLQPVAVGVGIGKIRVRFVATGAHLTVFPNSIRVPVRAVAHPLVTEGVLGTARWTIVRRSDPRYQTSNPY